MVFKITCHGLEESNTGVYKIKVAILGTIQLYQYIELIMCISQSKIVEFDHAKIKNGMVFIYIIYI